MSQASQDPRRARRPRWWAAFPYRTSADDQVSRRELLRFTVMASGALFAGTAVLAALGLFQRQRTLPTQMIARVGDVPPGQALYFNYPAADDQAVLLHLNDGRFVAFSARCTHLSCAVYHDAARAQLRCPCHEGVFDQSTGVPLAGPPQRPLPTITLHQEGDVLYAVDEVPWEQAR
jgi:Rieske Fe-S protein